MPALQLSRSQLLVYGSIGAILSLNIVIKYLPLLRFFVWTFFTGTFVGIVVLLYLLFTTKRSFRPTRVCQDDDKWKLKVQDPTTFIELRNALKRHDEITHKPAYPPSLIISDEIDDLLRLIIREYVQSWSQHITTNPAFSGHIETAIRHALETIRLRLGDLDLVEVIIDGIVPLITSHLADFTTAERIVRGKYLNKNLTESEELDLAIARKYRDGKLHPAANLGFDDTTLAQKDHLRRIVEKILPGLLPAQEIRSRVVSSLVTEVVACAVLFPVVKLLADPDTWNQVISAFGRSMLQDRKNVRKLRAALDQHATPPKHSRHGSGKHRPTPFIRLQPKDDERTFERFIRAIRLCNNLSDARRMRNEISSQMKRDERLPDVDQTYIRRLEAGKRMLDQKVATLSNAGSDSHKLVKQAVTGNGDMERRSSSQIEGAKCADILRDPTGLSYFMEHMERRKRLKLVQFWLVVDGLRDPLEELDEEHNASSSTHSWTQSNRDDIDNINKVYLSAPELKIDSKIKNEVRAFLEAGREATSKVYHRARAAILRAQSEVLEEMQTYDLPEFKKSDRFYQYLAADDLAATTQAATSSRDPIDQMSRSASWADPRKTSEISEAMSSSIHSLDSGKPGSIRNEDSWDDDPLSGGYFGSSAVMRTGTPDKGVVQAMEAALNDIMDDPFDDGRAPLFGDSPESNDSPTSSIPNLRAVGKRRSSPAPSVKSAKSVKSTKSTRKGPLSIASLGLISNSGGSVFDNELFPDEAAEKFQGLDESDSELQQEDPEDQIHEAAPGDLGLAEAIATLTYDIEKLCTQEAVVDSLMKKAELTNNTVELRILRKSKSSLDREIRRKELQRQQYIVQESDNSLFGRASLRIKSYIVKNEGGKEYGIYYIEVIRSNGDTIPPAVWEVGRRYSEFFQLHQELRTKFPSVGTLDFPRRRVVIKLNKDFLEKRRSALEKYIQSLILLPEVCRCREFRSFLSQQQIAQVPVAAHGETPADLMTRLYNSISDGMEDLVGNLPLLDQLQIPFPSPNSGLHSATTTGLSSKDLASQLTETQAELSAFEASTSTLPSTDKPKQPLIKPIADLFLEVFSLSSSATTPPPPATAGPSSQQSPPHHTHSSSTSSANHLHSPPSASKRNPSTSAWLRGRAVVVVLHQLLGGAIEKRLRDAVSQLTGDEQLVAYIRKLRSALFSGPGETKKSDEQKAAEERTRKDKDKSKSEAKESLMRVLPELVGGVVGRSSAKEGGRKVWAGLNVERLNYSLVYECLDRLVETVFDVKIEAGGGRR
ncbi:hypothetical protein BJ508DRAFT_309687 [Ascobolus immersus RN42]|uniref:Intermediate filament protein n=1 Tax=Ascobolus immersus RN42 TaxID=1160509 RepID=A0A3N4HXY8_ASCIM|nr:hypothetical protein BJ508DRAFT_309687 [Ascobolus immersus RN42]